MPTFKINEDTRCELSKFKDYMRKQEYTDSSVIGYCTHLSRFLRQAGSLQASTLKESVETFLETERMDRPQTFKDCRAALRLYYRMFAGGSLKGNSETNSVSETAGLLQRFHKYSLEVKHIEESTVISEISHVRGFLEYTFERNPQGYANELTAEDIRNYVVERLRQLSVSSKGRIITSIRNFFRCQAFLRAFGTSVRIPLATFSGGVEKVRVSDNHGHKYFQCTAYDTQRKYRCWQKGSLYHFVFYRACLKVL